MQCPIDGAASFSGDANTHNMPMKGSHMRNRKAVRPFIEHSLLNMMVLLLRKGALLVVLLKD